MKTVCKTALAVFFAVFAGGYCAFATTEDVIAKTMKVSVSFGLPPQAKTTGSVGVNSSSVKNHWVKVNVKFRAPDEKVLSKRYLEKPELAVELAAYPNSNKEKCVIFKGKVDYFFLEQDGKDHQMKVLLPAVFFRRFCDDRSVGNMTFIARAVLSFGGKQRAVAYGSSKGIALKDMQTFFRALPVGTVVVDNALCGRSFTPWSMIEVNRFEFEKHSAFPELTVSKAENVRKSSAASDKKNGTSAAKNKNKKNK